MRTARLTEQTITTQNAASFIDFNAIDFNKTAEAAMKECGCWTPEKYGSDLGEIRDRVANAIFITIAPLRYLK